MKRIPFFQRPFAYKYYNATIILVALNVVIFLLRYLAPNFHQIFIPYLVLVPNEFIHLINPWSIVSYLFIHADPLHIIFNMISLLLFGLIIEQKLGSSEFLLYYFVIGILSGVLIAFVHPLLGWGETPVVGSSGAIYGLMLAYATFFPQSRILLWGIIPIKAYLLVLGLVVLSILASIFNFMANFAHIGHLGGVFFGLLYFMIRLRINPIKEIIYSRRYYL